MTTPREEPCQHEQARTDIMKCLRCECGADCADIIADLRAANEVNRQLSEVRNQQVHELIDELAAAEARAETAEKTTERVKELAMMEYRRYLSALNDCIEWEGRRAGKVLRAGWEHERDNAQPMLTALAEPGSEGSDE